MRCYVCDWEGSEEEMEVSQSSLFLYDYIIAEKLKMEVTRQSQSCPRCHTILASHRLVGGVVFDGG
ncbi:MAG: hypothetical protein QW520_01940 [Methanomassiliicoccales archaeon]